MYAEVPFRNQSKIMNYLRTLPVLTCHALKQVMCTYYLLESTTLFEQKVIYTSAELEGG
jgi:hypothetical protein